MAEKRERRIIFLDIDGVLNSHASMEELRTDETFGKVHVDTLNEIIRRTGAQIVVTSVWRLSRSVARLQCILNDQDVRGKVIDRTSSVSRKKLREGAPKRPKGELHLSDYSWEQVPRGEEIDEWLHDFTNLHPDDKVTYIIIDDDKDMLPHQMPRFIHTGDETGCITYGLLPEHIDSAVKLLKNIT